MVISTYIKSKPPPSVILRYLERWCEDHFYDHFLVSIILDNDTAITEVVTYKDKKLEFVNPNWYDGEKYCKLVGFIPVSCLSISNIDGVDSISISDTYEIS